MVLFRKIGWLVAMLLAVLVPAAASASGFGQGVFGANVPFGSATSISIALGGDVSINLVSGGSTFSGTGSHTVTVTSTDVVGYMLYAHPTGSTALTTTSGATIPASNNSAQTTLATNTWGYNINGATTTFLGMPTAGVLLKDATGPFTSGDPTTVTYGALADVTQAAGNYSLAITYTAVAKNP